MNSRQRTLFFVAAIIGFLSVAFGAFGAHALKDMLSEAGQRQYDLGVRYAFIHALVLLATGLIMPLVTNARRLEMAGWFFISGVVMFSGSLILLGLTGIAFFASITPLGGLSFLLGWAFFAFSIRECA